MPDIHVGVKWRQPKPLLSAYVRQYGGGYAGWKRDYQAFIPRVEKIELGVLQAKIFIPPSVILAVPKRLNQSVITPEPEKRPIHAPCLPLARCSYLREQRPDLLWSTGYLLLEVVTVLPGGGVNFFSLTCAGTSSSPPGGHYQNLEQTYETGWVCVLSQRNTETFGNALGRFQRSRV